MNLLLTGVSGLTGRYILNHPLRPRDAKIVGTSRREHAHPDFTNIDYRPLSFDQPREYAKLIAEFRPDVIVHLGGEANVDNVQKSPEESRVTNLEFPLFLLEQAGNINAKVVQFSSNAVYDGTSAPYKESALANPINYYGQLKAQVDAATRRFSGEWLILRPIVMYGWNYPFGRGNPVSAFVPMLLAGKQIKMVTDQFENPVYAQDVAAIFWKCVLGGRTGEFNMGGGDQRLSRYDWISGVAGELGVQPSLVQKALMNDFSTLAPRPRDTRLDVSRVMEELAYKPKTALQGLQAMLADSAKLPEGLAPAARKAA